MMPCRPLVAVALAAAIGMPAALSAQSPLHAAIEQGAAAVAPKVVTWRRDFHQHPELSNREVRTSGIVAAHLRSLGIEVRTGVAKTGVVGVLRGGKPGPVVALRADMDALPVTEEVDVPYRSRVRTEFGGQEVGVMHACGHDLHTASLMGAAEVLAGMRANLPGTVVFLFQPAEEGAPPGERGGASVMIEEGALDAPKVDAIFGLHVFSGQRVGDVLYRPNGIMASSDTWDMIVHGRQTHGALPWGGVDPIVAASQVVVALQSIVSRQVDLITSPVVVTVGTFQGGVRFNIIPDSVVLSGTIRTFDPAIRLQVQERLKRTAEQVAASSGARAEFSIRSPGNPVTFNDPALTERMRTTLERVAGPGRARLGDPTTTAEDFAHYQQRIPGMFVFVGATPEGVDLESVGRNHSPRFVADEGALPVSVRLLANLAVDYLAGGR